MTHSRIHSRRAILGFAIAVPVLGSILRPALAEESDIFAPGGLALGGYDTVAYFTEGRARPGRSDLTLQWRDVTWRFATSGNREAFHAKPPDFMPQYGGYCAYAVAQGSLAESDPEVYSVVGTRLYLNQSPDVQAIWRAKRTQNIARADRNWPGVLKGEGAPS